MDNVTNVSFMETTPTSIQDSINLRFSIYDYIFLVLIMGISGGIGFFFGFCGNKQTTAKEFLFGGRNMKVVPVALSLVAE